MLQMVLRYSLVAALAPARVMHDRAADKLVLLHINH
jgi:hypothetical protein